MEPILVVHGGTGSPPDWSDGCDLAAAAGREVLLAGGTALDATIAAVRVMEDDGRFNTGLGAVLRLDGETIEMDAGLMTSDGRIGAVAALRGFHHPISVAREVMDSPHLLFAGEGAARFAAQRGAEPLVGAPTPRNLERHREALAALRDGTCRRVRWRGVDVGRIWNFRGSLPDELRPRDTVGAVARDRAGRFAAANSTGGAVPMLLGRVGDSPLPGAGYWAGPAGAVATTGVGEEIIRRLAAREIYDRMVAGLPPERAVEEVVALFPDEDSFGAVAVTRSGHAIGATRTMAGAVAR
jgi:L-asparaginase/beta-aspartyl-peptidase (threonine type)